VLLLLVVVVACLVVLHRDGGAELAHRRTSSETRGCRVAQSINLIGESRWSVASRRHHNATRNHPRSQDQQGHDGPGPDLPAGGQRGGLRALRAPAPRPGAPAHQARCPLV
jgi:hypothetical protein